MTTAVAEFPWSVSLMDEFLMARESAGPVDVPPGAGPRSLLSLLGHLLTQIDPIGHAGSTTGSANRRAEHWEDDAYIYLEAMVPEVHELAVDICVYNGKVIIRMEK
jgi:hypothetical protein